MKKAVLPFILAVCLGLAGCDSNLFESLSDDSSDAAAIESARMALDEGRYQVAIDLLEPGYDSSSPNPDLARILASAYMGKAGVDLTYLIENSGDDDSGSFDTIAAALSLEFSGQDGARFITYDPDSGMLEDLEEARSFLDDLLAYCEANGLTPEQNDIVQQGMASAIHFILQLGMAAAEVTAGDIPVNGEAYRQAFPDDGDLDALLGDLADQIDDPAYGILDSLQADLASVSGAVDVLDEVMGPDEDIAYEFSEFLTELLDGSPIEDFSGAHAAAYVRDELLEYE